MFEACVDVNNADSAEDARAKLPVPAGSEESWQRTLHDMQSISALA